MFNGGNGGGEWLGRDPVVRSTPPYCIKVDADGRTIRVTMHGDWAVEHVDPYMADIEAHADAMRRRFGQLRVVVDLREAPVWSRTVANLLTARNRTFYKRGDRLALILSSSMSKVQARPNIMEDHQALFLSPRAAELWISAR